MQEKIRIYTAAALFSGRETFFNINLANLLEERGYLTDLPQKDGFEFGNLEKFLNEKLSPEEISSAIKNIIYFLDVGFFIPRSDIIVSNLDEPIDEGVAVEITYGRTMGKYVVGFRTDVRSPYGNISDSFGGMHFFPAFQCNKFILHSMRCKNIQEADEQFKSLADKIDDCIQGARIIPRRKLDNYVSENPYVLNIISGANILFKGIDEIHSEEGIIEICNRYINNKNGLKELISAQVLLC